MAAVPLPLIALGAFAAAGGTALLAYSSDHLTEPGLRVVLLNWVTLPFILGGLVARRRRPDSRFGGLMIAAGFAMYLSSVSWANAPLLFSAGQLFDLLPAVLILHVFLAFPTGRLPGRPERWLLCAAYPTALGFQLGVLLTGGFGPGNAIRAVDAPAVADRLHLAELVILSVLLTAGAAVLAVRRRTGGRPARRAVELLVDSYALVLVMLAAMLLMGAAEAPAFTVFQRVTLAVVGVAPVVFLLGLLNERLARGAVGRLLLTLRDEPADLRGALARALHDPSLAVVYWLPEFGSWADEDGAAAELPAPDSGRSCTVIERESGPVAALLHDPSLDEAPELLDAVCAAVGMALDNGWLRAELRAHLDEVRGSRLRVLAAGQQERQRLERNLHDGAQQRLVALQLSLGRLQGRQAGVEDEALLAAAKNEIGVSLDELRDIARGLHPAVLSGHGLAIALESLAARATVPVELTIEVRRRLGDQVEIAAYYVVSESLANAGKHAAATSAGVHVSQDGPRLVVEVTDDGVGGADSEAGGGLRGLADRVEALGGSLKVWSPPGGGTRVRAELPCG